MPKSIQGTQTEKNLLAAFAGESQARNRYTYPPSHLPAGRQGRPKAFGLSMNTKKQLLQGMSLDGQALKQVGG